MSSRSFQPWWTLDNAAKIFPSSSSSHDSKVFRFVCELEEPVEPEVLQTALNKTMERFPMYRSVLKRGLFWYYLEDSALPAVVRCEDMPPCQRLYPSVRRSLLFRVLYFRRRINLEVHHSLTDGAGAQKFLCALVYEYLLARYPDKFAKNIPKLPDDASQWEKQADSFQKYYQKMKGRKKERSRGAYQLRGEYLPKNRLAVLEGRLPLDRALACARARGATLTELMTAVLLRAISEGMWVRERRKPVVITVPVNLRSYFPSESARNFFATIPVAYDFGSRENSLDAVLEEVKASFRSHLTKENMQARMNAFCALEHSVLLRLVPLFIKDVVLRIANKLALYKATASFSNVGRITMPAGMEKFIRQFGVYTCGGLLQACACSFGSDYVVSFASPFREHEVERVFFQELKQLGLEVVLTTNIAPDGGVN